MKVTPLSDTKTKQKASERKVIGQLNAKLAWNLGQESARGWNQHNRSEIQEFVWQTGRKEHKEKIPILCLTTEQLNTLRRSHLHRVKVTGLSCK